MKHIKNGLHQPWSINIRIDVLRMTSKIEGIRLLKKHWRYQRKQGQSLIVGASPQDKNAIDWYGECVDRFDEAQNGGFPNVLDK